MSNSVIDPPRLGIQAFPLSIPESLQVFAVMPPVLDLDSTHIDSPRSHGEYEVVVRNRSEERFSLQLVSPVVLEGIEIDVPSGDIAPGKEKKIKVKISPELDEKLFTKSFTIEASDSANTRYTVPIVKKMRWGPEPPPSN